MTGLEDRETPLTPLTESASDKRMRLHVGLRNVSTAMDLKLNARAGRTLQSRKSRLSESGVGALFLQWYSSDGLTSLSEVLATPLEIQ